VEFAIGNPTIFSCYAFGVYYESTDCSGIPYTDAVDRGRFAQRAFVVGGAASGGTVSAILHIEPKTGGSPHVISSQGIVLENGTPMPGECSSFPNPIIRSNIAPFNEVTLPVFTAPYNLTQ
jgi:hypothetical protein